MRIVRGLVSLLVVGGCSFRGPPGTGDDAFDDASVASDADPDASEEIPFDIAHVPAAQEPTADPTTAVVWSATVTIDTRTMTITPDDPSLTLQLIEQDTNTTSTAFLAVRTLVSSAAIRVVGDKPLIIYASESLTLTSGSLDISAIGPVAGAGARSTGMGVGKTGTHAGMYSDGGGGGGGFGTAGGDGGVATQGGNAGAAGVAGVAIGEPAIDSLLGGSPGGDGQPGTCTGGTRAAGGGGGGAIQLSSPSIQIDAVIVAGGGGGDGGGLCTGNMASAAGGGSGGAIYIQATMLAGSGVLAANGGGGGAGSNWNGGPGQNGAKGADARTPAVAVGANQLPPDGGRGGNGAVGAAAPQSGESITSTYPNGGGGGGGAGRIYLDIPADQNVTLTSTPPAARK